jgi:hypothetical protein
MVQTAKRKSMSTDLVTKKEALELITKHLREQDLSAEVAEALLVLYGKIAGWKL